MEKETFTITIEPTGDGRVTVSVPEIGEQVVIDSTLRNDAIDAAHRLITAYLLKERQVSAAQAR